MRSPAFPSVAIGQGLDVPLVVIPPWNRHTNGFLDLAQEIKFVFGTE